MRASRKISFGPFVLDTETARLRCGDEDVVLRPKSLGVLAYLIQNRGRVVSKEELMSNVWPDVRVSDSVVKVCIREIRKALAGAEEGQQIETVPRQGYRYLGEAVEAVAGEAAPSVEDDRAPFVGRDDELAVLGEALEEADRGKRRMVFVTGEPGIGKTALVDRFVDDVRRTGRLGVGRGQCLERYGQGEAYLPIMEAIAGLSREPQGSELVQALRLYAPTWLVELPALVDDADMETLRQRVLGATRERMFREITEALEAFGRDVGLLLVLEDLQWSDHSTLELLAYLGRRREASRLMVVGTYRESDVDAGHPLRAIKQELLVHRLCDEIPLPPLTQVEVASYVQARTEGTFQPRDLGQVFYDRTHGNPLFMTNLMDFVMEHARAAEGATREEVERIARSVPASLQGILEKQIDELGSETRAVLEGAAVAGMDFAAVAVAAGIRRRTEKVEEPCNALAKRRYLLRPSPVEEWPDGTVTATYSFTHSLHHHVLYDRLMEAERMRLHQLIGKRREEAYGSRSTEIAGELAIHFECARDWERAARYQRLSGEQALRRRAYREAADHFQRALEMQGTLSVPGKNEPERARERVREERERMREEMILQASLGGALIPLKGAAAKEVEWAYARAYELCEKLGDVEEFPGVLGGLWSCYQVQGRLQLAGDIAELLFRLARRRDDRGGMCRAHLAVGTTLFWRGDLTRARDQLERGLALSGGQGLEGADPLNVRDVEVALSLILSLALWVQGYPDEALERAARALRRAQELDSPFDLGQAMLFKSIVHHFRGEVAETRACIEPAGALGEREGFTLLSAAAALLTGWASAQGARGEDAAAGIRKMERGIEEWTASGTMVMRRYFVGLLAQVRGRHGDFEGALRLLDEALAGPESANWPVYYPELCRLKGELLLARAREVRASTASREAEEHLFRAAEISRRQGAKGFELRAALSLCDLAVERGGKDAKIARQRLKELYAWFQEGFETADLKAARARLKQRK